MNHRIIKRGHYLLAAGLMGGIVLGLTIYWVLADAGVAPDYRGFFLGQAVMTETTPRRAATAEPSSSSDVPDGSSSNAVKPPANPREVAAERASTTTPAPRHDQMPDLKLVNHPGVIREYLQTTEDLHVLLSATNGRGRPQHYRLVPSGQQWRAQHINSEELRNLSDRQLNGHYQILSEARLHAEGFLARMNEDIQSISLRLSRTADQRLLARQQTAIALAGLEPESPSNGRFVTVGRLVECGRNLDLQVIGVTQGQRRTQLPEADKPC